MAIYLLRGFQQFTTQSCSTKNDCSKDSHSTYLVLDLVETTLLWSYSSRHVLVLNPSEINLQRVGDGKQPNSNTSCTGWSHLGDIKQLDVT